MKKLLFTTILMLFAFTGFSQRSCGFEGNWDTDWGPLKLTKSSSGSYSGYYVYNGVTGYITARITNTETDGKDALVTLAGRWEQGKAKGTFQLTRVCSRDAFSGTWKNDNGKEWGNWYGKK